MKKAYSILSIISLTFISLSIIYYNYYSLIANQSNHTGIDLMKVKIAYLVLSITIGIIAIGIKSNKTVKKILIITGILGLLFVTNIWIFEKIEVMLKYEDWLKCCM